MMWWILGIYIAGFLATLVFNMMIIVGPASPGAVLRNALLWPVMLPVLILLTMAGG